jgi:hypothetical protein
MSKFSLTVLNPLLYTCLNEQFRTAFAEYFRSCRGKAKSRIISGTNADLESIASVAQPKINRMSQRLSERCSNMISGVILDVKGRNSHIVRNTSVNMSSRTTHSSLRAVRSGGNLTENSPDLNPLTSKLIEDQINDVEDSHI